MDQTKQYLNQSLIDNQSILGQDEQEIDLNDIKLEIEENADDNQFMDKSNLTFNFEYSTSFQITLPHKEIIFAIQKYCTQEFLQLLKKLEINTTIKQCTITVTTDKDESEHQNIKDEMFAFYQQFKSAQLFFDYDTQRAINPSQYILNKCQEKQYFLIKIKNLDNQLELYLVTRECNLQRVQQNIQQKFRGIRIFFQDATNRMTQLRINGEYKTILTQLRQKYYEKTMKYDLEEQFKFIEFQDVLERGRVNCSQIIGLNFPYYLNGKNDFALKIYRYVANIIMSWLIIFIKFEPTESNIKLARLLENITNNKKNSLNRFLCASSTNIGTQCFSLLGHPQDLQELIAEISSQKDKFSGEFSSSMQIGILTKNFDFSSEGVKGSFSQLEEILKKKKIIVTVENQLRLMKITEKCTFVSYCNLMAYLCKEKYKQSTEVTEAKSIIELEYIKQKIGSINPEEKLFNSLDTDYSFIEQDKSLKEQPQKKKLEQIIPTNFSSTRSPQRQRQQQSMQQVEQGRSQQEQSSNQRQQRNQGHARVTQRQQLTQSDQKVETKKKQANSQAPIDQMFNKSEEDNDEDQGGLGEQLDSSQGQQQFETQQLQNQDNSDIDLPSSDLGSSQSDSLPQIFEHFIITNVNEANQSVKVSKEYSDYFKQLIKLSLDQTICMDSTKQNIIIGFIPIKRKEFFQLKKFEQKLRIYTDKQDGIEYCNKNNDYELIQVRIYEQAIKQENNLTYSNEHQNEKYYCLQEPNQVYPIKKIK